MPIPADNPLPDPRQRVVLRDVNAGRWLSFRRPRSVVAAWRIGDVLPALEQVQDAVDSGGLYAAGFIAYEAAAAFDSALATLPPCTTLPLLWFGLFEQPDAAVLAPPDAIGAGLDLAWAADVAEADYTDAIDRIKRYIERGHTYQVNFTYRLRSRFAGDPWQLFLRLAAGKGAAPCAAFVSTPQFAVCSASPELFFTLNGDELLSRPMKGTAARGLTLDQDQAAVAALTASEKERAENLMIVDMIRNDMGRVALPGTVRVPRLFTVEKYPTVWQTTSTVTARVRAGIGDILRALFPCASITGAPKVRTMQIIAELETTPRGVYTGMVGFLAPGRRAQFNVAIRTVTIDRARGQAEYGVGGGIVWDSEARREADECRAKAKILSHSPPRFSLLESILWTPGDGYVLLPEHLARLARSARYFDFSCDLHVVRTELDRLEARLSAQRQHRKVRLLLGDDGRISLEAVPLVPQSAAAPPLACLARTPIDPKDRFLYHKTTNRQVYERAKAECPEADEVILWNDRGEVTEGCIANVVAELNGQRCTPPVECGLLPGVCRESLLRKGWMTERVIRTEELTEASRLYLINSVRGIVPARFGLPNQGRARAQTHNE